MKKKDWFLKVSTETYPQYAPLPESEWVECLQYRDKSARNTVISILKANALVTKDTHYDGDAIYPVMTQGLQLLARTNIFCAQSRFSEPIPALFNSIAHTSIAIASFLHTLAKDTLEQYSIFGLSAPEEDQRLALDFCLSAEYTLKEIPPEFITTAETEELFQIVQNRINHFLKEHLPETK